MRYRLLLLALALGCPVLGCQVDLPEGKIACGPEGECPDGWTCRETLCFREGTGTNADGGAADAETGRDDGGWDAFVDPDGIVAIAEGDDRDRVTALVRHGDLVYAAGDSDSNELRIAGCAKNAPTPGASSVFLARLRLVDRSFVCEWLERFDLVGEVNDIVMVERSIDSETDDVRAVLGGQFIGSYRIPSRGDTEAVGDGDAFVLVVDAEVRPGADGRLANFFHFASRGLAETHAVAASGPIACAGGAIGPSPVEATGWTVSEHDGSGGFVFCLQLVDRGGAPSADFSVAAFLADAQVGGMAMNGSDWRLGWQEEISVEGGLPAIVPFTWDAPSGLPRTTAAGLASETFGRPGLITIAGGEPTLVVERDRALNIERPRAAGPEWTFEMRASDRLQALDIAGLGAEVHLVGSYAGDVTGAPAPGDVTVDNGFHLRADGSGNLTSLRTGDGGRLSAVEASDDGLLLGGSFTGDQVTYPALLRAAADDEGEGFVAFLPAD